MTFSSAFECGFAPNDESGGLAGGCGLQVLYVGPTAVVAELLHGATAGFLFVCLFLIYLFVCLFSPSTPLWDY